MLRSRITIRCTYSVEGGTSLVAAKGVSWAATPFAAQGVPPTSYILVLAVAVFLAAAHASRADQPNKPENPREMFRSLGVDDSYFGRLVDGRPIDAGENETLLRVLFRLRTFPLEDIERWALDPRKLAEAIREPELTRGSIFRLRGRVTEVEPIKLSSEAGERYELNRCFRCRLQLGTPSETADVYTEAVPAAVAEGRQSQRRGRRLRRVPETGRTRPPWW